MELQLHFILLFIVGLGLVVTAHALSLVWVARYLAGKWEASNNRLVEMLDHTLQKNSNALNASTAALYFVQAKNGAAVGGPLNDTTHFQKTIVPIHHANNASES